MTNGYTFYKDHAEWDDLFLVCDRNGTVVKVIVIRDYYESHEQEQNKAERICRWLNRRPPLRIRLQRQLRRFDPTGNHETWPDGHGISNWLYGDWGADEDGQQIVAGADEA